MERHINPMRRLYAALLLAVAMAAVFPSCHKNGLWDELPGSISSFIVQYYPGSDISSYSYGSGGYNVRLKDGPGMIFDKDYNWVSINGYGIPLPELLLFDQFPPGLYEYLQETEQLDSVFSVSRSKGHYTLSLLASTLGYPFARGVDSVLEPHTAETHR